MAARRGIAGMTDALAAESADDTDIPVRDWQGAPLDCAACAHAALRAAGACEPGRSCVMDAYARRIDRFFRTHPALANDYLAHPYFEVRAIAVRHADLFRAAARRDDPDETVRLQLALRAPQGLLRRLRDDPHREVRIRVSWRIAEEDLSAMLRDADYEVRKIVARRIAPRLLAELMRDADLEVRRVVAARLPMPALWRMADDPAPEVRREVAQRLPAPLLGVLAADLDWTVRWEVAGRAHGADLERLARDDEADVRERAAERLGAGHVAEADHG
jgi:hypothetical protein